MESSGPAIFEYAKVAVGAAVSVLLGFWSLVRLWVNSRFERLEQANDAQDLVLGKHDKKLSEHTKQLAEFHTHHEVLVVHFENGNKERQRIEKKIDSLISEVHKISGGN